MHGPTAGHEVGINVNLLAAGSGGLTKLGNGTLTLAGSSTYRGTTSVHDGTLRLALPSLPPASRVEIAAGAELALDFSGSISIRSLVIGGVSLAPGVYNAATHPGRISGTGSLVISSGFTNVTQPDAGDGISGFRRMKYGYFVHYVFGGTLKSDGSSPRDANDMADRFDAAGVAEDLQSMGVEYVIFTAWHYNMVCLWPSTAMEQWMPGHAVNRDLLGDLLDAVRAKGIRVLFYTHPRDGHNMNTADQITTGWAPGTGNYNPDWNQFNRPKWNDFINDIYADLINRYGNRIDGLFIDEGSPSGDSWRVVDYPRLSQTIKSRQPDLLMMQNFYGTNNSCDIGATEVSYWGSWVPGTDPNNWPATGRPMSMVMGSSWAAIQAPGSYTPRYNSTEMCRMTVLRAGVNSTDGGGVNWASGPYAGGGWETGVREQMQEIGAWIAPIRRSICNTYPSQSWVTPPNSTLNGLSNGIVATRSAEDGCEFIHVLIPPAGNSLAIPAPADGRGYLSARLLASGNAVALVRNADGSLTLTLQNTDTWNALDTVIELKPVNVTWTGNGGEAGPDTAAWSDSVDYFTGGSPVATRFRSGDGVNFSGNGASHAYLWQPNLAVGDLKFSGSDYHIHPNGPAMLTLATGRIDVANGITATFHETGSGGPLTLAGNSGLTKTGGGTLILDLPASYTGNTVLTNGTLAVRDGGSGGGNIVFNGGTLRHLTGASADISGRIRHSTSPVRIDTNGNNVTYGMPLDATNSGGLVKLGAGTLSLGGGLSSIGGPIVVADGTLKLDSGTAATGAIPNSGFETPAYAAQGWSYNPSGPGWTFSPASGIASNNTPWVATSPQGVQTAFIQNSGSIRGEFSVPTNGYYHLNFTASNRPSYPPSGLVVGVDDITLAFTGTLSNGGVLDIMTWNGTLPAGFVNHGIVLDRSNVRITSCAVTGADFSLTITGYPGHTYQLQRTNTLPGPWVDTGAAQPGGRSALTFSDPGGGNLSSRFYRISVTP